MSPTGTLDGTDAGAKSGFLVAVAGVVTAIFKIGANGAAFDVGGNTVMTIMDLLLVVDAHAVYAVL